MGWLRYAALAGVLLSAGCSLLLDFDEGAVGPTIDASTAQDSGEVDAPPDPTEPANNDFDGATVVTAGTHGPFKIDPKGDHDFFAFTVDAPSDVVIEALFTQAMGDLDMKLYDATRTQIGGSMGFVDNERITRTAAMGGQLPLGSYYVEIYSFNDLATNTYSLVLTVTGT